MLQIIKQSVGVVVCVCVCCSAGGIVEESDGPQVGAVCESCCS